VTENTFQLHVRCTYPWDGLGIEAEVVHRLLFTFSSLFLFFTNLTNHNNIINIITIFTCVSLIYIPVIREPLLTTFDRT
jgi:hypothetical protein